MTADNRNRLDRFLERIGEEMPEGELGQCALN